MYSSVPSAPWHPGPNLDRTPSSPPLTSPASPSRTSRLRGLSYLRTYTQTHILSRDNHNASSPNRPGVARATSYPTPTTSPSTPAPAPVIPAAAPTPLAPPLDSIGTLLRQPSQIAQRNGELPALPTLDTNNQESTGETSGWLPAVEGLGVLHQSHLEPLQSTTPPSPPAFGSGNVRRKIPSGPTPMMARTRSATSGADIPEEEVGPRNEAPEQNGTTGTQGMAHQLPSIKFSAHQDPRASRPSLAFAPMARILPTGSEIIKVGRYSERDSQPIQAGNAPSAAPVGFKSKVVSRRHCEFWCTGGRWFIKDVKSSSGTFLNHIRLSSPGSESKPFPINDGDIVQLGIDFKGGEEMIFRCVKIRVELNKGWQVGPSSFNVQSHKRLREINTIGKNAASGTSQDCAICLGPIAPCQSLFVAPCSHTWHYKCIRVIINGPHWPHFICPNCRSVADLEAELDEPLTNAENGDVTREETPSVEADYGVGLTGQEFSDLMKRLEGEPQEVKEAVLEATNKRSAHEVLEEVEADALSTARRRRAARTSSTEATNVDSSLGGEDIDIDMADSNDDSGPDPSLAGNMRHLTVDLEPSPVESTVSQGPLVSNSTVAPVDIVGRRSISNMSARPPAGLEHANLRSRSLNRTPSPNGMPASLDVIPGNEGPMTPRNDVGPFIFDGSAGRLSGDRIASGSLVAVSPSPTTPQARTKGFGH